MTLKFTDLIDEENTATANGHTHILVDDIVQGLHSAWVFATDAAVINNDYNIISGTDNGVGNYSYDLVNAMDGGNGGNNAVVSWNTHSAGSGNFIQMDCDALNTNQKINCRTRNRAGTNDDEPHMVQITGTVA